MFGSRRALRSRRRPRAQLLHLKYFRDRMVYSVNNLDGRLDNIDQRITKDVELLTVSAWQSSVGNFQVPQSCLFGVFILITSIFVLRSPPAGYLVPLANLVTTSIVAAVVTAPVVKYTYLQNKSEGTFRFLHTRTKVFAECIVFYGGQARERAAAAARFDVVIALYDSLLRRQAVMFAWTFFSAYFAALVGLLAVAVVVTINPSALDDGGSDRVQNGQALLGVSARSAARAGCCSHRGAGFVHRHRVVAHHPGVPGQHGDDGGVHV